MASIIAIEKDGVVYMGVDAVKQRCDVKYYLTKESNLSVHKMKSGVLVGTIGLAAVAQQMWLHEEWFEIPEGEEFNKRFIVTKILPQFYEAVKNHRAWEEEHGIMELETGFIMAYKSDIYLIFSDLSVSKCRKIACMSNEDEDVQFYAYASTYMDNNPDKTPEDIIRETYKFAAPLNLNLKKWG